MKIDTISWKILELVQTNGRISAKELASKVHLSVPATSERLRKLEEAGIIEGYKAQISAKNLGYHLMAVIGMTTLKHDKATLIAKLKNSPEVIECLHVTGNDSYLIKVIANDIEQLEKFVESINDFGETRTSIVMSEPIPLRPISKTGFSLNGP